MPLQDPGGQKLWRPAQGVPPPPAVDVAPAHPQEVKPDQVSEDQLSREKAINRLADALTRAYFASGVEGLDLPGVASAAMTFYVRVFLSAAATDEDLRAAVLRSLGAG